MAEHVLAGIGDEAAPDLAGQVAALHRLGWPAIELRTVDRVALAELDEQRFDGLARQLDRSGLRVVCVDSRIGNWARPITAPFADDLRELAVLAQRCRRLRTRFVRIMSYPNAGLAEANWQRQVLDRIGRLVDYAERHELVLLHENCAGWAGADADRTLAMLAAIPSPALRVLFDTGNGVPHGYDAFDLLSAVLPHVAHVHVKDAEVVAGQVVYTVPGAGSARVAECLDLLLANGYSGAFAIEPHLAGQPHTAPGLIGDEDGFVACGQALVGLLGRVAVR